MILLGGPGDESWIRRFRDVVTIDPRRCPRQPSTLTNGTLSPACRIRKDAPQLQAIRLPL
jgi:hypothetical protein